MNIPPVLPLSHVVAKFAFEDGSVYNLEHFSIGFGQAVDYKNQPQHETLGGQIMLVLSELVQDNIYEWAKTSYLKKNGTISFETEFSNPVLCVEFFNAYCVKLERNVSAKTGTITTLLISPESVILNDITHNNNWK